MSDRKEYLKNYRKVNQNCLNDYQRFHGAWVRMRKEILELLGGKCIRCGFSDSRALQIDHINGGGYKEKSKFKTTWKWYQFILEQLKNGSKDYQLLCANCNWIKRSEDKECGKEFL
jgi:hypothetical protein